MSIQQQWHRATQFDCKISNFIPKNKQQTTKKAHFVLF